MKLHHLGKFVVILLLAGCTRMAVDQMLPPLPVQNNTTVCDTTNVTWTNTVQPIINANCVTGCHNNVDLSGGIDLTVYTNVAAFANEGSLVGTIVQDGSYTPMPYNEPKMDQCAIDQIRIWVEAGYPQN